jgi:hypothetical protein
MLTVRSDKLNTTPATNEDHYNIGMYMMVAGVPKITNEKELEQFVARALVLDLVPSSTTLAHFVKWVRTFGKVYTNVSKRTDADVAKSVREHAVRTAKAAIKASVEDESPEELAARLTAEGLFGRLS